MDIPVDRYLEYSLSLNAKELTLQKLLNDWLPDDIIDCHTHCGTREHVRSVGRKTYNHMLSTFPFFSLEDSLRVQRLLHPGKNIRKLRFPKTFSGIEHRGANDYLLKQSPHDDRVAIFGLPEDIGYTIRMLEHPRCSALKMYYSYIDPNAETVYECFPREVLEEAQRLDIPLVLHLPKMIVRSLPDLLQVLHDFPRLRVSLAHLGVTKSVVPGLREAYETLAPNGNVWLDTALNPSRDVVALALSIFGENRVMFGSDEPLHLIRSVAYVHPEKGERLATAYPYHWVEKAEHETYKHLAKDVVHAHWQSLGAIYEAVCGYPSGQHMRIKERIFRRNAATFFGF